MVMDVMGPTLQKSNYFGCELARMNGDSDFLFVGCLSSETRCFAPKGSRIISQLPFFRGEVLVSESVPHLFPSPLSNVDAKKES